MNNQPTTAVRRYPQRPERTVPVSKQSETSEALRLFNAFVSEARKEFRKRKTMTVNSCLSKTDCDSVTFIGEQFSLTIDFTGGITL